MLGFGVCYQSKVLSCQLVDCEEVVGSQKGELSAMVQQRASDSQRCTGIMGYNSEGMWTIEDVPEV